MTETPEQIAARLYPDADGVTADIPRHSERAIGKFQRAAAEAVAGAAQAFCAELGSDSPDVPQLQLRELHDALAAWENASGRIFDEPGRIVGRSHAVAPAPDTIAVPRGWRTMDSAPKSGTWVLLWWPHWHHVPQPGYYSEGLGWQSHVVLSSEGPEPLAWKPLDIPTAAEIARLLGETP